MEYISLYRKYRPLNFDEIVGQNSTTTILKNQILNNKVSHAYLFSGIRGTGKTSSAKVFARAINCLNPKDGNPCNKCKNCTSILNEETTDVIEMDAASNNSVEDIRDIRSNVGYATTNLKYKVYIIDEVHMLTTSAFNALLKTLEEPPKNVVFILATTERHKVPVTILSRCLTFDFCKLSENVIVNRLKEVLDNEKVKYDEECLNYIAKLSDGALRDALSILERCLSEDDTKISIDIVRNIVGSVDEDILNKLVQDIIDKKNVDIISNINLILNKGKNLRSLVYELTNKFLELLIESNDKDKERLSNIITEISALDNSIRYSTRPDIMIKAALIRIANSKNNNIIKEASSNNVSVDNKYILDIKNKLSNLENNIININDRIDNIKVRNISETNIKTKIKLKKYVKFEKIKEEIIKSGNLKIYSALSNCQMFYSKDETVIKTSNEFAYKIITSEKEKLEKKFKEYKDLPEELIIELIEENKENKMEKMLKTNNIEYTNLD